MGFCHGWHEYGVSSRNRQQKGVGEHIADNRQDPIIGMKEIVSKGIIVDSELHCDR